MKLKTLFTLSLMITATTMQAQIIHVPADQPTIQAGIDAATDGDTVLVAEDTYFENIRFLGKAITVASEFIIDGDESHIDNTVINGSEASHPDSAACVMFIDGEDTTSVICGFTITGGSGIHDPVYNVHFGGGVAVYNAGAKIIHNIITLNAVDSDWAAGGCGIGAVSYTGDTWLVVRDNTVVENSATTNGSSAFGGGMNSTMNSIIQNNTIAHNTCENLLGTQADGGGIEIEQIGDNSIVAEISGNTIEFNELIVVGQALGAGIVVYGASASIHHNTISFNIIPATADGIGGGIFVQNNLGMIDIAHNEINGNEIVSSEWARGGGIALWEPPSKINLTENTIEGNTIEGTDNRGPGVWIRYPSGAMIISGNLFKDNIGPKNGINSAAGGGLCIMDATGEVNIDKNIFIGNEIYNGGGLYIRKSNKTVVTNNVFDGNKSYYGGGITYYDPTQKSGGGALTAGPWPLVANNTLIDNEASSWGGGIFLQSYEVLPVIFNCIIRDNTASGGNDIYSLTGAEFLLDHCNVNTAAITGNWMGGNNINLGPAFLDDSCHLSPSCVCVEAGTVAVDYNGITYTCPDHDIDGEMRPMNTTADIGVDEVLLTGMLHDHAQNDPGTLKARPNPFTGSIAFIFELDQAGRANLVVYDPAGRPVRTVASPPLPAGKHEMVVDAAGLTEGVYTAMLITDGGIKTCKIIKVR